MSRATSLHKVSDFLKDRHPYQDPPFTGDIDGKEIATAFGSRAIPKLLALLSNKDLSGEEILKALKELNSVLSHQEAKVKAIQEFVVPSLIPLVRHANPEVVAQAVQALGFVGSIPQGRDSIKEFNAISCITESVLPPHGDRIRVEAAKAIEVLSMSNDGSDLLVQNEGVAACVRALSDSKEVIVQCVLRTLYSLTRRNEGQEHAIAAKCVTHLFQLTQQPTCTMLALECLWNLARHADGKVALVSENAVEQLTPFLSHADSEVRRIACGVLLLVVIEIEAKKQAHVYALKPLVRLLRDNDASTVTNARATIRSISEYPPARATFTEELRAEPETVKWVFENMPLV